MAGDGGKSPQRRKDLLGDMTQGTEHWKGLPPTQCLCPATGQQLESNTTYVRFYCFKALDLTWLEADSNLPEDKTPTGFYVCAHRSTSCHPNS